jgi:hypothetical protein
MNMQEVRAYKDRIIKNSSYFHIALTDRSLFAMIREICLELRQEEPDALDLTGSKEGCLFVVVAGGWPRDLVVSLDCR